MKISEKLEEEKLGKCLREVAQWNKQPIIVAPAYEIQPRWNKWLPRPIKLINIPSLLRPTKPQKQFITDQANQALKLTIDFETMV